MALTQLAWICLFVFQAPPPQEEEECCRKGVPQPWSGYNKGIEWTMPNKEAFQEAKKDHRLILYFHLVGDLNKGGC